ncbi:AMP-binding protein [Baekduia sp.]|uniref:AMP-binding protein n=1 Tax=Baekduia sp. TaxID=2600305 RepID=UPI002DF74785|nr:AMP-binding protein [Baekduia sp.]
MGEAPPDLWRPLGGPARAAGPLLTAWADGGYRSWSWDEWRSRALEIAADLRSRGVVRETPVACLLVNSLDACAAVLGIWMAGGVVVSLPLPARGMAPESYLAQLRLIVGRAEPTLLLTDRSLAGALGTADLSVPVLAIQDLRRNPAGFEPDLPATDETAFVQFSSGSTTEPKGCMLTPAAIARQLEALSVALAIDPERDIGAVWLPMSHDMGLFGCVLLTYWTGHRLVLGTPQRFLAHPLTWLDDIAAFGATVSALPAFALSLVARRAGAAPIQRLTLEKLVLGGDRIDPRVIDEAVATFDGALSRTAMLPAYGLAEAVLAVTMSPVGRGPRTLIADGAALERGELVCLDRDDAPGAVALCSCGPPVGEAEIRIDTPEPGRIGEIVVRGGSLASGYLRDAALTASHFGSDELRTGDFGVLVDGELYVLGRTDDLIPVAGRNVYARDLEDALADVEGVGRGRCAVVDVGGGGRPELVALVEGRRAEEAHRALANALSAAAVRRTGIALDACVFVAPGVLPKTPSGKLQRFRCRALARQGEWSAATIRLRTAG